MISDSAEHYTVIVACECPETASRLVEKLSDSGFGIVGPVDRACTALALAAQTPFSIAVVGSALAGRRDGAELAVELMNTWGAASILIEGEAGARAWEASGDLAVRLRDVVASLKAPTEAC